MSSTESIISYLCFMSVVNVLMRYHWKWITTIYYSHSIVVYVYIYFKSSISYWYWYNSQNKYLLILSLSEQRRFTLKSYTPHTYILIYHLKIRSGSIFTTIIKISFIFTHPFLKLFEKSCVVNVKLVSLLDGNWIKGGTKQVNCLVFESPLHGG